MGKTIAEKILARASGRGSVSPGDYLEVRTPAPTVLAHHSFKNKGAGLIRDWGGNIFDPGRIRLVDGHLGATASHRAGEIRAEAQRFAAEMGIEPDHVYDIGRSGVETMVAVEHGWPLPGACYFQGVNGHVSTAGALGAFVSALSFGTGAYLLRGYTWVRVPRTVRIEVVGEPAPGVMARDVSEHIIASLGPSGAVGHVLEWGGEYVGGLTMDERFSLCSQALFTGAWTSIINPDDVALSYASAHCDAPYEPLVSDPDADYVAVHEFDVGDLEPQIVAPPTRHAVGPVATLAGRPVNRGFIGSDCNGWLTDLRRAASLLRGRELPRGVILNITPGTVGILRSALDEDLISIFVEAGCVVPTPNEGMEWGANTPLGSGDVCVATAQTNYPGRMGSDRAEIYLANPLTVVASCLAGRITDPRELLAGARTGAA